MRVVYLTDRVSLRGGADQHLLQVVRWAVTWSDHVTVAAGRFDERARLPDEAAAVKVRSLSDRHGSSTELARLAPLLAESDLVHVQNVMNPDLLAAATETGRAVVTVQDHRFFCPGAGKSLSDGTRCRRSMTDRTCAECLTDAGYRARMLEITRARRDAIRGASLVTLSRYMADELAVEGLPGAHVIPPWVQAAPGEPETGEAFLLAGRLVAHKAPGDAWAAWRRSGCGMALRVAGAGPAESGLEDAERLGWLEPSELARELRSSRALLFPSRWQEPFGVLGIEALSQATPVIATRSGGTDEWSDAGCVVVEPGDVRAMADAIRELALDPEMARSLGRAGRDMVADRFERSAIEDRLGRLYRSVGRGCWPPGSIWRSIADPMPSE